MSSPREIPGGRPDRISIQVKDWVEQITVVNTVDLQRKIIGFLLFAYGFLLVSTIAIFFLQGFRLGGFNLDAALLKWLGAATIGEIAGLMALTLKAVFRR